MRRERVSHFILVTLVVNIFPQSFHCHFFRCTRLTFTVGEEERERRADVSRKSEKWKMFPRGSVKERKRERERKTQAIYASQWVTVQLFHEKSGKKKKGKKMKVPVHHSLYNCILSINSAAINSNQWCIRSNQRDTSQLTGINVYTKEKKLFSSYIS